MRQRVLFTDLFNFAFRRNARVPTRAGQEQARSCVTFVAGTRERGRQLFGDMKRSKGRIFRFCALFMLRAVCGCRPRSDSRNVGACHQNNFDRLSVESFLMWVVTLQTQKQHRWELSYMQSRHRHEADRACDRHELTFTLSIAMVTFGQLQQYSTRI